MPPTSAPVNQKRLFLDSTDGKFKTIDSAGSVEEVLVLESGGTIPAGLLPSYVDDVVEVASFSALPVTGETGKIYVTLDNNKTYRWGGSAYVEISASPGSTDAVPEGNTNKYFTTQRAADAAPVKSVAGRTGDVVLTPSDVGAASPAAIPIIPTIVIDDNVIEFFGYPTTIASSAFASTGVTAVQIGNSVTSIGDNAFEDNSLTSVTIPNSVTSIGDYAFASNSLTSVTIPDSVTSIGSYAFGYNSLTSVTIGNSVTSIGSYAFRYNSLTSVTIGNSVTTIGSYAFYGNSLTTVILAEGRTTIPANFAYDTNAAVGAGLAGALTIPDSVTSIGSNAFHYNSITSVTIGNSVTSIGSYAFRQNSLTSVTIPNSVTTIGDYAFKDNDLTSVTIGNSVTTIGSRAFEYNSLTSVTIPASVTSIGYYAFRGLTTVIIASRTSIPSFFSDGGLSGALTLPEGVVTIGEGAFFGNQLTSVNIPASVTSIGNYAFSNNSTLATVNCYVTKTIIDAATNIFQATADPLTINVPTSGAVADTWTAGTGLSIGGNTNVTVAKNL